MLREGVAICLVVLSMIALRDKRLIISVALALLALFFHTTSVICLLIYPYMLIGRYSKMNYKLIVGVIMMSLFTIIGSLRETMLSWVTSIEALTRYESYLYRTDGLSLGLGNLIEFILLGLPAFISYNRCKYEDEKFFFKVYLLSYVFFPFAFLTQLFQRISLYFSISGVIVLPLAYSKLDVKLRPLYLGVFIMFVLYRFVSFFFGSLYGRFYMNYHTIFD